MDTYVKQTKTKGRGVFADRDFKKGEVIEICPVIVIPEDQRSKVEETVLENYDFEWGSNWRQAAIVLGYGSLYNHSYEPNAYYDWDFENGNFIVICFKDIKKDEEITFNYNGDPKDNSNGWFD